MGKEINFDTARQKKQLKNSEYLGTIEIKIYEVQKQSSLCEEGTYCCELTSRDFDFDKDFVIVVLQALLTQSNPIANN